MRDVVIAGVGIHPFGRFPVGTARWERSRPARPVGCGRRDRGRRPGARRQRRRRDGQGPQHRRPDRPHRCPGHQRRGCLRVERVGTVHGRADGRVRCGRGGAVHRRREGAARLHRGLRLRGVADRERTGGQPALLRDPGAGADDRHRRHRRGPRRRLGEEPPACRAQPERDVPDGGDPRAGPREQADLPAAHAPHALRAQRGGRGGRPDEPSARPPDVASPRPSSSPASGSSPGRPTTGSSLPPPTSRSARASAPGPPAWRSRRQGSPSTTSTSSSARTPTPAPSSSPTPTSACAPRGRRQPCCAAAPRLSADASRSTCPAGSSPRVSPSGRQVWGSCTSSSSRSAASRSASGRGRPGRTRPRHGRRSQLLRRAARRLIDHGRRPRCRR